MIRKASARDWLFFAVVLLCCGGLYLLPSPPSLLRQEGTSELAYVTKVDNPTMPPKSTSSRQKPPKSTSPHPER